jgi:hypothetical protein
VIAALVLLRHAPSVTSRPLTAGEVLAGISLLMLAPAALAAYVWRARRVWVQVDPERGLILSGKGVIPWNAIRRVRRQRPRLRQKSGPVEVSANDLNVLDPAAGCLPVEAGALGLALVVIAVALVVAWAIFFVFLPLIVVPVLEVFAPFGERFTIETTSGRPLVLRDLREAEAFVAELRPRVTVEG